MPFPKNFTKTKWLAFFAELSSKISHHSPSVIVEGAELLRRLLLTQLGVAAFLEEDQLLQQLCNTLESLLNASGRQYQGLLSNDTEAALSLLQCLSEIVSLSIALFNEHDPYYSLLVISRMDSTVLKMLSTVLRSHVVETPVPGSDAQSGAPTVQSTTNKTKQSIFFGYVLSILQMLIGALPIGSYRVDLGAIVPAEAHLPNSAAVRHVRKMESLCRCENALLEMRDTLDTLIAAQTDADGHNATAMALKAIHKQISSSLLVRNVEEVMLKNDDDDGHRASSTGASHQQYPELHQTEKEFEIKRSVTCGFDKVRSAKGHGDVHLGLNTIWSALVADGAITCSFLDESKLSSLERFCRIEPRNVEDLALFRSILCFFAALCHVVDETPHCIQRFLIDVVTPSLISMIKVSSSSSSSKDDKDNNNNSNEKDSSELRRSFEVLTTSQFLRNSGAPVEPVQRPSPTLSILLFLQVISTMCRSLRGEDLGRWVRAQGLFLRLMNLLEACGNTSSPLLEAPYAADGTLPDELYLQSALSSCRNDISTNASIAMKLIAEIVLTFGSPLQTVIGSEMSALVKTALPLSVRIASHHPTMACASGIAPSLLHYVPLCIRSTRPCSVGESALFVLDSLVASALQIEADTGDQLISFDAISPWLPNLVRCTQDSVQPHLRAIPHRLLVRVCRTSNSLRHLIQTLPSFTTNAAKIVLDQSSRNSWEVAGAASWLSAVLRIAANDPRSTNVPLDMLLVPSLPRNLLKVASSMPASYGSGALLQLLCALAERQSKFSQTSLPSNDEAELAKVLAGHAPDLVGSVVAPDGSASVSTWTSMLENFTSLLRRTDLSPFGGDEIRSVSDDALFRARGAMEEQTSRAWYAAQLFHAVRLLVERHRDLQRAIPVDVVCDAVGSLLSAPLPSQVKTSLENKYAVSLPKPSQLLESTEEAIRSAMTLMRVFFDPSGVQQGVLPAISRSSLEGMCDILGSVEISPRTRALVAAFLNDVLSNPSQTQTLTSVENYAADLFMASRASGKTSDDVPAIFGLRCRLVSLFESANHASMSCNWLSECVKRLSNVVSSFMMQRTSNAVIPNDNDQTEVQFALSGISSVLAFPSCLPLEKGDLVACSNALLSLLKLPWAQSISIRACRSLANSPEGRSVLACDLPSSTIGMSGNNNNNNNNSPLSNGSRRGNTNNNSTNRHHQKDTTTLIRSPFAKLVQITFFGKLPSIDDATVGTDAISMACLRDPDLFAPWLIKFKVLESVSTMLALCSRQKISAPIAVYRFLASATAAEDMRLAVAHNSDVVELLTEAAESVTAQGTLALMTLRNLSFSTALKNQICTNNTTLNLFKRVLWMLPSNTGKDGIMIGGGSRSSNNNNNNNRNSSHYHQNNVPKTSEEMMMMHAGNLDLFRRQELAASAFWALVDGNQRAKSFIRNILNNNNNSDRCCTLDEVRSQLASVGRLSDLPGYPEKVTSTIDILESHGLGSTSQNQQMMMRQY